MSLKKHLIKEYVQRWVSREFNMIPNVLFERRATNYDADEILELIDSPSRLCPECYNKVERGNKIECKCEFDCECELDPTLPEYEGNHHWKCDDCNENSLTQLMAWESLPLKDAARWPGSHGTSFWTTYDRVKDFATNCGFYVYEPQDFDGLILTIDSGGYNFYDAHWIPLYHAMDIKWHECDERWKDAE